MNKTAASSESYAAGLARAFGGALLFALPLLMTMEMWSLGFHMERARLAMFLLLSLPLIFGLVYYAGFRSTRGFVNDALDALSALAVGLLVSFVMLSLFGLIRPSDPLEANVGKVALQAVPAAMGATLARKQLGGDRNDGGDDDHGADYRGELFLMAAGALFLAFNVAPTEEMVLIAYTMTNWHTALLALLSVALLHVLVFRLGFAGQEAHESARAAFVDFTLPGYAVAILVSLYVLWSFGRMDGLALSEVVSITMVMGLPACLGAALARLVV